MTDASTQLDPVLTVDLAARVALRPLLPPEKTTAHRAGMVQTECPYCKSASCFATDVEFRCEECGGAGGVLEYCMARDGRTEDDASAWLASRALTADEASRYIERCGAAALANDVARKWYHTQFINNEDACAWWDHRGFTLDRAKAEMIGLAPADARSFLDAMKQAYVSRDALIDAGLVVAGRTAGTVTVRFRDRLLFPITDSRDVSTIAFTGRAMQEDSHDGKRPKYLNTGASLLWQKRRTLYGLGQARATIAKTRTVYLVEGQFGVLRCIVSDVKNVVASSGTAFTPAQAALLAAIARGEKPRSEIRLVISYDEDAGRLARAAARVGLIAGFSVRIVPFPKGEDDPDAYGRTHGGSALQALLHSGVDALEVVYRASSMHTGDDLACVPLRERMRAIDDVRDYVLAASSPKVRKASATAAAGWYGTTPEEMLNGSQAA
jgi:DNA primase